MNLEYLYKNWAKIGGVALLFIVLLLFFNLKVAIGSYQWFFWLNLPLYMLHQVEEYVYPGGFKEELNKTLMKQTSPDYPLTDRVAFYVNVIGIWVGISLFNVLGYLSILFPLIMIVVGTFNPLIHIGSSLRFRRYNPGLVVSITLNLPMGIYVLYGVVSEGLISTSELILVICVGIVLHWLVLLPIFLKWKRNRRNLKNE